MSQKTALAQQILDKIDSCVLCALCLPYCPTFVQSGLEAQSPRGRIMLMQALVNGLIPAEGAELDTLNHCLLCRGCEAMCPSSVPYSAIFSATKQWLQRPKTQAMQRLLHLVEQPQQLQLAAQLGSVYQKSGLQKLVRNSGLVRGDWARMEQMLPPANIAKRTLTTTLNATSPEITLFGGCMGNLLQQQTIDAILALLPHLGIRVHYDKQALCCGALHSHSGDSETAAKLLHKVQQHYPSLPGDLVAINSSCVAHLRDQQQSVTDICSYLLQHWQPQWQFTLHGVKVLLHSSCSNRNWLKNSTDAVELLDKISGIEWQKLPEKGCCGAGGSHVLEQPEHAQQFVQPYIEQAEQYAPQYIVSANLGCALHLSASLLAKGVQVEVIHPVTLLYLAVQQ